MPLPEILQQILDARPARKLLPDYIDKLRPVEIDSEVTLWEAVGNEDLQKMLKEQGLTKGQRAGITRILGNYGFAVHHTENGGILSHRLTVGDIRQMTDDQISGLSDNPSERSLRILRALFGHTAGEDKNQQQS